MVEELPGKEFESALNRIERRNRLAFHRNNPREKLPIRQADLENFYQEKKAELGEKVAEAKFSAGSLYSQIVNQTELENKAKELMKLEGLVNFLGKERRKFKRPLPKVTDA